jgi:serine/threonine protein kinase/tetratricopeptide (TPR) repeat protein
MTDGPTLEKTPQFPADLEGKVADRFIIRGRLGAGGMGEVYRADDSKLNRPVALKRISPRHKQDPRYRAKFRREARRASTLYDPHIAGIHDVIEYDDEILLVMEYVEGSSLRSRLGRPFELTEFLHIAAQCVRGLMAAHAKDVVHRDIKPENIMLTTMGKVKICDFGLARQLAHEESQESTVTDLAPSRVSGTPAYMAPECRLGSVGDQRADIFSLGVVFYEMLSGQNPFAHTNSALCEKVTPVNRLNPAIPSGISQIIDRMLARDPSRRYATAQDVLTALESSRPSPRMNVRRVRWLLVSAAALASLFAAVWPVNRILTKVPVLTERDDLLISHIANNTGEAVFDETMDGALALQLSQSPFLNIVSEQRIQNALRFMGMPADTVLTSSIALALCKRESLKAMLTGSLAKIGNQYVLSVAATNCSTGDSLAAEQAQVGSRETVLGAVSAVASKLRNRLGESLTSVQKFDEPIERATTPSLEAFQAFSLGNAALRRRGKTAEALTFFKRAVELDPNFALAYARVSQTYFNREERSEGAEYARKAFDLRDRVSEREKLYIEITYYHTVTGETDKTPDLYEVWRQTFPRDLLAYTGETWILLQMGIRRDSAIELAKTAVNLDPAHDPANRWLALSYLVNNRFSDARQVIEQGIARGLDSAQAHALLYRIAFAQDDAAAVETQLAWQRTHSSNEPAFTLHQAHAAAFSGKLGQAAALYRQAKEAAEDQKRFETAATIAAEQAFMKGELGSNTTRADVSDALKIGRQRNSLGISAITLARRGFNGEARDIVEELKQRFPTDFYVNTIWIPVAEAAMAINQLQPDRAIELLRPTTPYELGADSFSGTGFRSIYVRGQAYLAMHAGADAVREFTKIIEHRGVFPTSPLYSLSYLGLARAYAQSGDVAKSRENYEKFLALWREADPDLLPLMRARLELTQLNRQDR